MSREPLSLHASVAPLLRRGLVIVSALVVGSLVAVGTYAWSLQPGAAVVKAVFELKPEVTPPTGFASIRADVREIHGVPLDTPGAPDAHMDVYTPRSANGARLPVVLWIHGGGFISSSADTVADYAVLLAHRGFVVASLDYTLAPGAKHPAPVEQANTALASLRTNAATYGGDPTRIFLGGDSAGAQIASEVASVETNHGAARAVGITPALAAARLRGVVLFCGLYDMSTVGTTGFPALRTYLWAYTGYRDWTAYPGIRAMSTTSTATAAYPPTFLSVGDADPFRTQEAELAANLRSKSVPVTTLTWTGTGDHLGHEYQFDFTRPQARTALTDTVAFLNAKAGEQ
jgi:acetyl esterase/lipase